MTDEPKSFQVYQIGGCTVVTTTIVNHPLTTLIYTSKWDAEDVHDFWEIYSQSVEIAHRNGEYLSTVYSVEVVNVFGDEYLAFTCLLNRDRGQGVEHTFLEFAREVENALSDGDKVLLMQFSDYTIAHMVNGRLVTSAESGIGAVLNPDLSKRRMRHNMAKYVNPDGVKVDFWDIGFLGANLNMSIIDGSETEND